jgi:hypothetical protein
MAIRWLQQPRSPKAILSALMTQAGVSRRQAYRYLLRAQSNLQVRPVPEPKAVFTVNLPRGLIQALRKRCRRERRPISHVVAEVLQAWLEAQSGHG